MFTSIGAPEILVIFLIILILFGADKLPEIARGIGKGMDEFKKASDNLKNEFENEKQELNDSYKSTFKDPWTYDTDEDYEDYNEDTDQSDDDPKVKDNHQNSN